MSRRKQAKPRALKGKINMKSENITRKTECKLKEKSQHLISDTEENWRAPSRSRKTKCSYFGQEDTLEELSNKSSSPDLGTNSELRKRNRQKSPKWFKKARRNALASETESENIIEEIPVKESRIKIPTKRTNGPVTGKPNNQKKLGKAVESFPDTNENWTEEELQKLYRAVASFLKHKSDFWLDVAKTVRTRSAEECQQRYMADQEGRKRCPNKTTKPRKKEERDRVTQQPLAKVGTLKRKQQMRNFLEQMPKDNHDDIFASTPFQNKNTKLPQFYMAPEEDVFQLKDRHPITPASAIFPWVKTPQCDHVSPGMLESLDRKNREKLVFRMEKNIKGKEHTWLNVKKKSAVPGFTTSMSPKTNVFTFEDATTSDGVRNLFEVEQGIQSDEEDDMYFST